MTPEKVGIARQIQGAKEHTVEAIAKTLGVSRKTIYRHLGSRHQLGMAQTQVDGVDNIVDQLPAS